MFYLFVLLRITIKGFFIPDFFQSNNLFSNNLNIIHNTSITILSYKKYIFDEERYFNYPKEIDYYTGLVRSDIETFNLIYTRFKKVFEPMDFILNEVATFLWK